MIIELLTWVLYGIVIFLTFKGCNWVWARMSKKRACQKQPEEVIVIHKQQQPQIVQEEPKKAEKNIVVNNYSFGSGL